MPNPQSHHSAHYDADGNIIIDADMAPARAQKDEAVETVVEYTQVVWNTIEEQRSDVHSQAMPHIATISAFGRAARTILEETADQFSATATGVKQETKQLKKEARSAWKRMKKPVLTVRSKNRKPRSRTTLFIIDTVRFGGTFAGIFVLLFVAINYQSFWGIAKAELAFTDDIQTVEGLKKLTAPDLQATIASAAQADEATEILGDISTYLPTVGPPDNRLVIPKLGKNIPIVTPAIDSLIKEDWVQFEKDVQHALQSGVAHYPGTAKPGQTGNFFVTGHSSYYPWDPGAYKDVFARLHELSVGDTYSVYYGGDLHSYRITRTYEVKPSDVSVLDQPTDKRIATLMTCTPIGTTLRRFIVQAEEVDPVTGKTLRIGEKTHDPIATPRVNALPI